MDATAVRHASLSPATIASQDNGPLPMSFPVVLRTGGLSDRFAHLRVASDRSCVNAAALAPAPRQRREDKEGKRWIRRKENGKRC